MIYGREIESKIIQDAIKSKKAELGVIFGRRRIGKSALLKSLMKTEESLYFEGIKGLPLQKQIDHFLAQLAAQTGGLQVRAQNWTEAFEALTVHISTKKIYVVLDEFPWMASERKELVAILKYFWDNKWKSNHRLTMVLCGSVASFMVKHVVHSEALHNRKTFEIGLEPLPINESKKFFKNYRSINEIAEFLMVFGGVPKYLEQIDPKRSLSQNIDQLCLNKNGFFINEFETLFKEQFKVVKNYEAIVKLLCKQSMSKEQIAKALGQKPGGSLTSTLDNLEKAHFIKSFSPIDFKGSVKTKTKRYVLWDEWTRFYLTFMQTKISILKANKNQKLFEQLIGPKISNYMGLSFEKLCLKNIDQILSALKIELAELSYFGPYFKQGKRSKKSNKGSAEEGFQVDIMLMRKRNIITLIECKFTEQPVDSQVIKDFEKKITAMNIPKKYSVERVLISANGAIKSVHESEYFHEILTLEDLV
jgi:uncharacterized protein